MNEKMEFTNDIGKDQQETPSKDKKNDQNTIDMSTQTNFLFDTVENEFVGKSFDLVLIEIGGTVGDIESQPFLEAERQMIMTYGQENCLSMHLTLVPYLKGAGEMKTKPTQHSAKELRASGIQPNSIICRSDLKLDEGIRGKISSFTNVAKDAVFSCWNAESVYLVPLM